MPARKKLKHDEKTKQKIKISQLLNRVQEHALGDVELMTSSQVQAALALIKKELPDRQAITAEVEHDHNHSVNVPDELKKAILDKINNEL